MCLLIIVILQRRACTKHYCLRRMMSEYSIVQEQSANMDGDNPSNKKKNLQVKNTRFHLYVHCVE